MPRLTPIDESFFDSAPERYAHTWSIARPAESVWAELTGERPLHWCRLLDLAWTSPRPFGVGTRRAGKVLKLVAVQEHFFIWEEGRRYTFYVERANLPLFTSLGEDYVVEPDGPDRCRFTWRIGVAPSPLGKPGKPLNAWIFKSLFADTSKYFNAS